MNAHEKYRDCLPFYVSGALEEKELRGLEAHLQTCLECQADLALWQRTAEEVLEQSATLKVSEKVLESALAQIHFEQKQPGALRRAVDLLLTQIPLVRREIWPASALIMLIGFAAAVLVQMEVFIELTAPLVAVWGIAALYGPENDPAFELAASTPTKPTQILLARLAAVFSYNLALALAVSLAASPVFPLQGLNGLILTWLAPMAFLTALALLLSLWMSPSNAMSIPYLLWLGKLILEGISFGSEGSALYYGGLLEISRAYLQFWNNV